MGLQGSACHALMQAVTQAVPHQAPSAHLNSAFQPPLAVQQRDNVLCLVAAAVEDAGSKRIPQLRHALQGKWPHNKQVC